MTLSAHDILRFRLRHAGWEVHQVFLRGVDLFYVELIEDGVRWTLQRPGNHAILSRRGVHADVSASLFDEVVAAHRAAIVRCLDQQLEEALINLQGARAHARQIRAAIAATTG